MNSLIVSTVNLLLTIGVVGWIIASSRKNTRESRNIAKVSLLRFLSTIRAIGQKYQDKFPRERLIEGPVENPGPPGVCEICGDPTTLIDCTDFEKLCYPCLRRKHDEITHAPKE